MTTTATEHDLARAAWERRTAERARSLKSLRAAANFVQVVGYLAGAVGVIAGVLIGLSTERSSAFSDATYPNLGDGIAIAVAAIATGAVIVLAGLWAEAWARSVD